MTETKDEFKLEIPPLAFKYQDAIAGLGKVERALFLIDLIRAEKDNPADDSQVLARVFVLAESLQNQLDFVPELMQKMRDS